MFSRGINRKFLLVPNVILNEREGSRPLKNIENIEILLLRIAQGQNDKNGKGPFGNSPNVSIILKFFQLRNYQYQRIFGVLYRRFISFYGK
ncbi:MAG: hypothetical protein A3G49_01895 [Candidatus Sungbacteria bacterium RIFCSPLOWO2_12_FULL_41_11]|uniref:Uncharacterized protein n=1 Tax=Candidatus Sungbacteria bacterium RIFCSPLOWO2_12_FULL_41_11 TaxID=1802286 RepID=A0A1G2LU16_9BACT|nr:MAG: hypothetical protein A3D41_00640 [Candidatus Sungbacteria bacterium RIFCSPHIGHO2_02_FULL_41_12b]OHA14359.1 MAG: hypothetical protein A3G49_01895 [Candidatus Sungbacteria bacterium RIFCSPLOWO2_12_FULL_41_11]